MFEKVDVYSFIVKSLELRHFFRVFAGYLTFHCLNILHAPTSRTVIGPITNVEISKKVFFFIVLSFEPTEGLQKPYDKNNGA